MSQRLRLLHLVKYVCLCAHIHVTTRTAGMHIPVYTYRAASVSMPTTACVCMCTHPREHAGLARNMYTHVNTCVHIQVSMCIHPRAHVRSWGHLRFHLPSLAYFSNGQIIPQAIPRLYNVGAHCVHTQNPLAQTNKQGLYIIDIFGCEANFVDHQVLARAKSRIE